MQPKKPPVQPPKAISLRLVEPNPPARPMLCIYLCLYRGEVMDLFSHHKRWVSVGSQLVLRVTHPEQTLKAPKSILKEESQAYRDSQMSTQEKG